MPFAVAFTTKGTMPRLLEPFAARRNEAAEKIVFAFSEHPPAAKAALFCDA